MAVKVKDYVCEGCGATEFVEENGYRICEYCGRHQIIQSATAINLEDDIKRLLDKCKNDPKNTRRYVNLILEIDPTNTDVYKFMKYGGKR